MSTIRISNPVRVMKVPWVSIRPMSSWAGSGTHGTTGVWNLVPRTLVSWTCRTHGTKPPWQVQPPPGFLRRSRRYDPDRPLGYRGN